LIEVAWDLAIDSVYKVNIMITSQDRPGMMSDIMNITSEAKLNIFSLSCHTDKNKMATTHMGLDINSLEQLEYVMNRIRRMKGVYTVERVYTAVILSAEVGINESGSTKSGSRLRNGGRRGERRDFPRAFWCFLGVAEGDTEKDLQYLIDKVCGLRVFEDENEEDESFP